MVGVPRNPERMGTLMVVVLNRESAAAEFSDGPEETSSWDTCRTAGSMVILDAFVFARSAPARAAPGNSWVVCSLTTTLPFPALGMKRTMRLTEVCGPPASSQGTQML